MTQTQEMIRGWRFVDDHEPTIGERLANSHVWDGDEPTEEILDGTCAFDARDTALQYARYSTGWLVEIIGDDCSWGDLAGEIIIEGAEVFKIERLIHGATQQEESKMKTQRTEEMWWNWHDQIDQDTGESRIYGTMEEAEAACAAWIAGESDEGPDDEQ